MFISLPLVQAVTLDFETSVDPLNGLSNLKEGRRLFQLQRYDEAAMHFWRAVLQQEANQHQYSVQDCFPPFLQCFALQGKTADGFTYVAQQSFGRGQVEMAKMYLEQALSVDPTNSDALLLQQHMGLAVPETKQGDVFQNQLPPQPEDDDDDDEEDELYKKTPEELYELGSKYFSQDRDYEGCADVFEIACEKSQEKLYPACANAVYCRNMIIDWGFNGTQFYKDMERISTITKLETSQYRYINEEGQFAWRRATSTHPHMMLGYPLDPMLKRYVTESVAYLDEMMARVDTESPTPKVNKLPEGLPYNPQDDRPLFQLEKASENYKIRIGFVASGFKSKAVLYLSHDMFRFFDKTKFEVHVFSMGPPDNPLFIQHGMRGVDWRERVKSHVDYFHDVEALRMNHVKLAQFIHQQQIHILIEWDGYARQGERAQGLLALRPAPVQILHQEYLGTSGAHYVDYLFTDPVASPKHLEHLYTEKFLYMPNHFFSKGHAVQAEVVPPTHDYSPPQTPYQLGTGSPQTNRCLAPPDEGPAAPSVVFCNFNKFLKNNPETVRSWVRILREVPNSMLCLLENPPSGVPYLRKFIHETAGTSTNDEDPDSFVEGDGVELNSRIHFLSWEANPFDHQRRSQDFCNVMLDSHPYNGHTVAQDALYGGVPIVTRSDGDDMASRVSTSANIVLGLEELNAVQGPRQYEDIAIELGNNPAKLQALRAKLVGTALQRNPMHPYWDVPRYVKNFEAGLTMAWERYLEGQPPEHITIEETEETTRGTYDEVLASHPPIGPNAAARDEL